MSRSKLASRSARERRKASGVQYKRFTHAHNGSWHECFYCGMPADTVDHFPPVSRVHDYRSLGLLHETYVTVSSCKECNSILADSLQETLIDRVEALKDKLQKRLKKYLKMPEWFQDEVDEMGAVMRSFIAGSCRFVRGECTGAFAIKRIYFYVTTGTFVVQFTYEEIIRRVLLGKG